MVNDLMVCRLDYQTWIKLPISLDIVWYRLSYSSMANDELNWTSLRLISGSLGLFNGTIFLFAESCAVNRGFFYNAARFARLLKCSTTEWSSFSWNSGGGYAFGRSTVLSVLCGSNFDTSQDSQIYLYMAWVLGVLGSSYLAAGAPCETLWNEWMKPSIWTTVSQISARCSMESLGLSRLHLWFWNIEPILIL